ncbi:NUC189-domain-containing protein [Durotheca rogersii]|uniref:NUC189-domain-containing protein n=1 Tax=Durotheca rogersii TaxID=419775 RepID=UPI00221FBDFC|nr:NUC189-domain-containing protein [Durotheca rogersii]KAI5858166.1 NUC189-domain-containing protein [Durotheca rogersii]
MSTKRRPSTRIAHPVVRQSAKQPLKTTINESETTVSIPTTSTEIGIQNTQVISISSDSGSSEYESDSNIPAQLWDETKPNTEADQKKTTLRLEDNGNVDVDISPPSMPAEDESDQEATEPTFGELARAHDTIDVPTAPSAQPNNLTIPGRSLAPSSLSSLGTVLSQALRTDDTELLESCLHTTDLATVRNTIQRLDSSLAGKLLTKLAARMHRRPGRAGSLMAWVQWTLVAHGGALATQPQIEKKLSDLHRVLEERSRGLSPLLALKGKLDLLEAQMELRRGTQWNRDLLEGEDEDGIVYVEGEESGVVLVNKKVNPEDHEDDDNDQKPVVNGLVNESSEDRESSEDEVDESDLEGQEDVDENDVNHEDVESDEEDSEREATGSQRPAKRTRTKRK